MKQDDASAIAVAVQKQTEREKKLVAALRRIATAPAIVGNGNDIGCVCCAVIGGHRDYCPVAGAASLLRERGEL
jgi:hypothetical protein